MNIQFHEAPIIKHKALIDTNNCHVSQIFTLLLLFCSVQLRIADAIEQRTSLLNTVYIVYAALSLLLFGFAHCYVQRHLKHTDSLVFLVLLLVYSYSICTRILFVPQPPSLTIYAVVLVTASAYILSFGYIIVIHFCFGFVYCAFALLLEPEFAAQEVLNYLVFCIVSLLFSSILHERQLAYYGSLEQSVWNHERSEKVLNNVPGGIAVFEITGEDISMVYINDAFFRMLRDTREARTRRYGKNPLFGVVQEDQPVIRDAVRLLQSGSDVTDLKYRSMAGDGTVIWLRLEGNVVSREADTLTVFCSFSNITEINRQLNEQLRASSDALALVKKASEERDVFYARMSHDMRTPLNGILGSVAIAIDAEEHSPQMAEYLHDIQFSGKYLLNLINDLLDLSKIDNGAMKLYPEPYAYFTFINDMTKMISPLCHEKNITLNMNPLPENVTINVDRLRFQQIFYNVFSNAVKYTHPGGAIDHFSDIRPLDETHIDCRCHIIDNGIGMSKEFQNHLFEPYARENNGENVQGSGLGLGIANELAHLMGGELTVKSELGKGTEVIIHTILEVLPPQQEKAAAVTAAPASMEKLRSKRILLCEDHALNAKIVVHMLEHMHMLADTAENGEIALDTFSSSPEHYYDLILMDIRMPVMDGLVAARAIRGLTRKDAGIPIVALSANAYAEDIEKSMAVGMNAHLSKPIEPELLYQTILDCLS